MFVDAFAPHMHSFMLVFQALVTSHVVVFQVEVICLPC